MLPQRTMSSLIASQNLVKRGTRAVQISCSIQQLYVISHSKHVQRSVSCMRGFATNGPEQVRVLSGIQPTGVPTLGNYLGALQNWRRLQDSWMVTADGVQTIEGSSCDFGGPDRISLAVNPNKVLYSIVDLHSITVPQDPKILRMHILDCATSLLAIGLDPAKCTIFQQSRVHQHAELNWILGCQTPIGLLNTMTQWKTKKHKADTERLGLFAYPVLQAADIMLYKSTHVPVGEDQIQHLQLCQKIVSSFNNRAQCEFFVHPKVVVGAAARVMDLRDPTSKMSKSARSDNSKINLTDGTDLIVRKIRKAVTDSQSEITYDPVNRPGVANLLDIYVAMNRNVLVSPETAATAFHGYDTLQFKEAVAQTIVDYLAPIQSELVKLKADPEFVLGVLDEGAERAQAIAAETIDGAKKLLGLSLT